MTEETIILRGSPPGSSSSSMRVAPIPIKTAAAFCAAHHRHLPATTHRLWAVGLWDGAALAGVAIVGLPVARMLCSATGGPVEALEVVRLAVLEGTPNGCSALYGACARAARAMGASALLTYTRADEPGTSLRAAGWRQDEGLFGGGEADRPSRPRKARESGETIRRHRWWAPWSLRRTP